MHIFEIPTVDITFVKENKESELTSYSSRLLEIYKQIKKESEKDIKFKKIKNLIGSLMNPYNASIYNTENPKQYWNILEYIYTKMDKKSGCYIDATSISWCGQPGISPEPLYYTNPDPEQKFDYITYRIIKDKSSDDEIHIDDKHDLDGNLYHLRHINKYLKVGGSALFIVIGNFNTTNGHLAFPYLLKTFFKKVIVCVTGYCIGLEYNGEILKDTGYPYIPSELIEKYTQFVKRVRHETIVFYDLIFKKDKLPFYKQFHTNTLALKKELKTPLSKFEVNLFLFILSYVGINPLKFTTNFSNTLKSSIFPNDGRRLYKLIMDKKLKHVLELGCATGDTSTYILVAAKEINGNLTSIDPDQSIKFDNMGLKLIELMKLKTYHTFIEEPFYVIAPYILLKKGENHIYDLVFINAYYTLDMTLIDIYFADKFISVGGYLIIDNYTNNGITTITNNIISYFKHYEQIPINQSSFCSIFKKIKISK